MSSVNDTTNQINAATSLIVLVSVVIGGVGLIFNVLVFTRPLLRREPSAVYFFSSTCASLILILIIQPARIAANVNMDMANYNVGICKIEFFALYVTRSASSWLIVLASIDRYFHSSTNARIRRISSLKTAKAAICITSVAIMILYSHMIIYYEIDNMSDRFGNITPVCNPQRGIYFTFLGFWNMILYSLCPFFLMLLFGLLTLRNLRQHRFVVPVNTEANRISRRTDTQLLRMLTAQVLVIIIFTLPLAIYQLYASFTSSVAKDTLRLAEENLALRTTGIVTYLAHSSSFYLYTLTGTVFRKELIKIIERCWHRNRNIVRIHQGGVHQMSNLQGSRRIAPLHTTSI